MDNKANSQSVIKVALSLRTISHYRVPIYRALNNKPNIRLKVFHGSDITGTKFVNPQSIEGFEHQKLFAIKKNVKTSGRKADTSFNPGLFIALLKFRPDVIITGGGANLFNNFTIFLYSFLFRMPVIWWTLGMLEGRKFSGTGRIYRRLVVFFERHADVLLGYSSAALEYFESMGYPREKCFRAVNCLDTDKIFADIEKVRPKVPKLRKELGLDGKYVILYVGAFGKPKALHRLLYAFAHVREKHANSHLLLIGDGPVRAELEQLSKNLGINEFVTFTGRIVDGVAAYFELATVFVLPGLGGLATIEAMAHGIPVICGRCDGTEKDYVLNGKTGFRFEAEQDQDAIEEIQNYLLQLLGDPELRSRVGQEAKNRICNTYNGRTYVEGIYRAIIYAAGKIC